MHNSSNTLSPAVSSKGRVALGMSGGVDSSVCAYLLKEQGYDVTGVFLECWRAPGCRAEDDKKDALKVALELDIPFTTLDFKDTYKDKVVEYFFAEYQAGRTPNPDVLCNKEIKFGLFYDWAMEHGFDYVATGHYAKITQLDQQAALAIPVDTKKDQTYFLYLIKQQQLDHTLFPLQDLTKDQVRQQAEERGLHVAHKKDSVGICFIGDIDVHGFLKDRLGENPGEVVDTKGNVIGQHNGLWFYTVGQRSGFTINQTSLVEQSDGSVITKHNIPPFYVIAKNPELNQLVVGFGSETMRDSFEVADSDWIGDPLESEKLMIEAMRNELLSVRIRHTGQLLPCTVTKLTDARWSIQLSEPARGIAAGQSAVFYITQPLENIIICLGGGIIDM